MMELFPEKPIFKIYSVSGVDGEDAGNYSLNFEGFLQSKQLISSKITVDYVEKNEIELQLQHLSDFEFLKNIHDNTQLILERMIYNDSELLNQTIDANTKFNKIFFINEMEFKQVRENGVDEETLILKGYDFKFLEENKILGHNVFYYEPLPEEEPDDFNKIKHYNESVESVFNYHWFNNILEPQILIKGSSPSGGSIIDFSRKIKGLYNESTSMPFTDTNGFVIVPKITNPFPTYSTTINKKNLLEFKIYIYDYMSNSNNVFDTYQVELMIVDNPIKNIKQFKVIYMPKKEIVINNRISNEFPSEIAINKNKEDYKNFVLIESNGYNSISARPTQLKNSDITTFESLESGESEDFNSLNNTGIGIINDKKIVEQVALQIDLEDFEYFKDIQTGDTLTLEEFNYAINGTFGIIKMSELIENDYIDYAIDELKKIN